MTKSVIIFFAFFLVCACTQPEETSSVEKVILQTSKGEIRIELYADVAPVTVQNFLRYVDSGSYDGAAFYRTTRADNDGEITVIQGGLWAPWKEDGDVDFAAPFPPIVHETTDVTGLAHDDGFISMARNEPGSASSEFFISIGENHSLDFGGARNPDGQGFAVFGKVVSGRDVIAAIHRAPVREGDGFGGQILADPVIIEKVKRAR